MNNALHTIKEAFRNGETLPSYCFTRGIDYPAEATLDALQAQGAITCGAQRTLRGTPLRTATGFAIPGASAHRHARPVVAEQSNNTDGLVSLSVQS